MSTSRILAKIATFATVLLLALSSVQPAFAAPSNDNFADATQITSLPFSVNSNSSGATFEGGEPYPSCGSGYYLSTEWFAYTPSTNTSLTARANYNYFPVVLAIYTGTSFGSLTPISCGNWSPQITFQAQGGSTYYFQVAGYYGDQGTIPFSLEVTPPPQVYINYYPSDPSVYDNVNFYGYVNDPGNIGGNMFAWTSSDGATSNQSYFNHQFAADGDYPVSLTFTTYDGRSNTANATVQVRTRDVAINKFNIPQTARVNQTKEISVDVTNKRYSDYVNVTLYKGLPGGGDQVIGQLTIYVPVRASRPTSFKFSYTFTSADATIGKVTFRAVATVMTGHDALPADNTAIATTTVSK